MVTGVKASLVLFMYISSKPTVWDGDLSVLLGQADKQDGSKPTVWDGDRSESLSGVIHVYQF